MMKRTRIPVVNLLVLGFSLLILLPAGRAADRPKSQGKEKSKAESSASASTLTGCVDERDGGYALVDERTLTLIANLEADGFPREGFAKHLGHKVSVRGQKATEGERSVFRVRSIATVSETCAPAQPPN
jgi:hypothetical protein